MHTVISSDENFNSNDTVITIPINKHQLGDFISNLLGQKQSLERTYDLTFEIDHEWLMNLHEMIHQRISLQANSTLINFSAVIYFENGAKRTITTIEAFRGFHETKPEVSNGVKIVWEYLVQFPNRTHPEKQQISFTASTIVVDKSHPPFSTLISKIIEYAFSESGDSLINVQIDHTERTWGDDIENIISSCIVDVSSKPSLTDKFVQIARLTFVFVIMCAMLFYPIYSSISTSSDVLIDLNGKFEELKSISVITPELINNKLDLVFDGLTKIEEKKNAFSFIFLMLIFSSPIFCYFFLLFTQETSQSFILLSKKSVQRKDDFLNKKKRKTMVILASYLLSILAGIIGNYGFQWLTN